MTEKELRVLWEDPGVTKIAFNAQYELVWLEYCKGWEVRGPIFDPMIAAFLLDENATDHSLQALSYRYCGAPDWKSEWKPYEATLKDLSYLPSSCVEPLARYNKQDLHWTKQLKDCLQQKINSSGLSTLFRVEMENLKTLARMTQWGIKVDLELLSEWERKYQARASELASGFAFNPGSWQQVLAALRASGCNVASTGDEILAELRGELPERLREYRSCNKILGTYLLGLREKVYPDGRIHPGFHQNRTVSGRLSSSHPNAQNFPRDTEELAYRTLFRGTWDRLLRLDFSQLELRVAAWLSQDPLMMRVYTSGGDLHDETGRIIWRKDPKDITDNERVVSKQTNFTALYDPFDSAIGSIRFKCKQAGVDLDWKTASSIVTTFRRTFTGWFDYMLRSVREVYDKGWVQSPFGRIRRSPGPIQSFGLRERPESIEHLRTQCKGNSVLQELIRSIVNSLVQGAATGDLVKLVATSCDRQFRARGFKSRICNSVHDEILSDIYPPEEADVAEICYQAAVHPPTKEAFGVTINVTLDIEMGIGDTWSAAKRKENRIEHNGLQ